MQTVNSLGALIQCVIVQVKDPCSNEPDPPSATIETTIGTTVPTTEPTTEPITEPTTGCGKFMTI